MAVDKDNSKASSPANGSEEESEYEIEAILDAKRGMFPGGRMGYFVKWKGYSEEDNSWVDEADAGNADALIKAFWNKRPRKPEPKGKRGRKSTVALDEESDAASASVAPKKRGRKSQQRPVSEEVEETDVPMSKKARTNTTYEAQENNVAIQDEDENIIVGNMSQYDSWPSWEELIKTIDTVEKDASGNMVVYFTLNNGETVRESSENCRKRCPQKLISFFEEHLRWKETEVEEDVL